MYFYIVSVILYYISKFQYEFYKDNKFQWNLERNLFLARTNNFQRGSLSDISKTHLDQPPFVEYSTPPSFPKGMYKFGPTCKDLLRWLYKFGAEKPWAKNGSPCRFLMVHLWVNRARWWNDAVTDRSQGVSNGSTNLKFETGARKGFTNDISMSTSVCCTHLDALILPIEYIKWTQSSDLNAQDWWAKRVGNNRKVMSYIVYIYEDPYSIF